MENRRRPIRNIGEMFRQRVIVPEVRDGKRCKSCFEPITDEKKWYNGLQQCDNCKGAKKDGIA